MMSSATPKRRKAVLRTSAPSPLLLGLGGRHHLGLTAEDDHHLFEPRKIDGRSAGDLLVDAEVALGDLADRADVDALREAETDAARDQLVADGDLVDALHVLDATRILALVARAAEDAARAGALHDDVDGLGRVDHEPHFDGVPG